ncbi:hypothetical protein [Roseobacter sp. MH60115]|uniref:hypothetical protein n=1 Tax=Roseobacter sp. MH60115 TaxID=2785324 RepID=UPI0018A2C6C8|nr:hypothetical protein [Roseobacter sp. MH60115]
MVDEKELSTSSSRVERAPDFASINRVLDANPEGYASRITWESVRSFGELQILTRASYIMLLVVPLMAGLWPTVRVLVNRYNQSLSLAREKMIAVLDRMPEAQSLPLQTTTREKLNTGFEDIAEALHTVALAIENASIQATALPMVWVVSFGASLCAVLGQTLYQSAAPQIIRSDDKRSYIGKVIEEEKGLRELNESSLRELILETSREYEGAANTNTLALKLSVVMYGLATVFIVLIVTDQTMSVLDASNLIPNSRIF